MSVTTILAAAMFLLAFPARIARIDTLDVPTLERSPRLDGRIDAQEYGSPAVHIATPVGQVRVWLGRSDGFIHIGASLPDSTFYWGDDLVISLDPDGSGGDVPGAGDRQWYLRRILDSSNVFAAVDGRWYAPARPPKMLGATRHHEEWDLASTSGNHAWELELRVRESVLRAGGASPRIAFRTYNDRPHGWWSWPAPPADTPAQRVERAPRLWVPLRLR